jgi:hypothetical protein
MGAGPIAGQEVGFPAGDKGNHRGQTVNRLRKQKNVFLGLSGPKDCLHNY